VKSTLFDADAFGSSHTLTIPKNIPLFKSDSPPALKVFNERCLLTPKYLFHSLPAHESPFNI